MASPVEQVQYLKQKNNELVQKVQYWIMMARQRDDEKLALMKENNDLRLKLSRIRNSGGALATNLDSIIQTASEQAISHLVKASTDIAHITEVTKAYMRDRLQLETISSVRNTPSGSPTADKGDRVHRVPPMMMGGQFIQPVVSLSRTLLNTSNPRPEPRSTEDPNGSVPVRAIPMHMLQDVYIPLTRIDASSTHSNSTSENAENSAEESDIEDCEEDSAAEESRNTTENDGYNLSSLSTVVETVEPEEGASARRTEVDNPLEGPSWLLEPPSIVTSPNEGAKRRKTLEPDSTTGTDENASTPSPVRLPGAREPVQEEEIAYHVYTPTVRRRKCRLLMPPSPDLSPHLPAVSPNTSPIASPHGRHSPEFTSPRPAALKRNSMKGRVLKVMVAKMRLSDLDIEDAAVPSPPKKSAKGCATEGRSPFRSPPAVTMATGTSQFARFDAPSPNGATDARVIVSETIKGTETNDSTVKRKTVAGPAGRSTAGGTGDSLDVWCHVKRRVKQDEGGSMQGSDSSEGTTELVATTGRTRRTRKPVTYTERSLSSKLRR